MKKNITKEDNKIKTFLPTDKTIKNIKEKDMKIVNIDINTLNLLKSKINFLVLVTTQTETKIIFRKLMPISLFKTNNKNKCIYYYESDTMQKYYIGKLFDTIVAIVIPSDMGSIKVNASMTVTTEAIRMIEPRFAVMLGICAGMNEKVNKGDVIISQSIISIDSKKESDSNTIYRCQYTYPKILINKFDPFSLLQFTNFKCRRGAMISSETLLDSQNRKSAIMNDFPEVLGYEMEGVGFSTSCEKLGVPWILIKGVCDVGENKSDDYQEIAMINTVVASKLIFEGTMDKSLLKFSEIDLLEHSIFCSGILYYDEKKQELKENIFSRLFAYKSQILNYRIVSGMAPIIGDELLHGIYQYYNDNNIDNNMLSNGLLSLEFPYEIYKDTNKSELVKKQRAFLMNNAQIALFMYGNKQDKVTKKFVEAKGMITEFNIAKEKGMFIIPVGATNFQANVIWQECNDNFDTIYQNYYSDENKEQFKNYFNLLKQKSTGKSYNLNIKEDCDLLIENIFKFVYCYQSL